MRKLTVAVDRRQPLTPRLIYQCRSGSGTLRTVQLASVAAVDWSYPEPSVPCYSGGGSVQ